MIIDKVKPFYTDKDYERLDHLGIRISETVDAQKEADSDEARDRLSRQFLALIEEDSNLKREIENRYIDSLNKDYNKLFNDVREIVESISQSDFEGYAKVMGGHVLQMEEEHPGYKVPDETKATFAHTASALTRYYLIHCRVQFNALTMWEAPQGVKDQFEQFLNESALKIYPGTQYRFRLDLFGMYGRRLDDSRSRIGSIVASPAFINYADVISAGEKLEELAERKKAINRNMTYTVEVNKTARKITAHTKDGDTSIIIDNIESQLKDSKPALDLFFLICALAPDQCTSKGEITRYKVGFSLQELVDLGMYKSIESARNSFNKGRERLTSIKVAANYKRGKTTRASSLAVLFTKADIVNGYCTIYLNDQVNWDVFFRFYTIAPEYFFRLSHRAKLLLYHIVTTARMHTKEVSSGAPFNISFRSIQQKLNLPDESTKNPGRDIKEVIEAAITEIEDNHKTYYGDGSLRFNVTYDDQATIEEYLDHGYLGITLSGSLAEPLERIQKGKQKKQSEARKRRSKKPDPVTE